MEEIARTGKSIIYWNGKNVTTELSRFLSAITYTDREEAESDDITISLENGEGLWSSNWYPEEGDTLEVFLGYEDALINCGKFQVDELLFSGPPDMLEIKAIAAGITKGLRTRNSKAFEGQTLRQIALFFCDKHKLTLIDESNILAEINLERKTQEEKTDLAFLSELAAEYGFIFSVRSSNMVFTSYYALDNANSIKSIDKSILSGYEIKEKTYDTYQSARLKQRDSKNSLLVDVKIDSDITKNKPDVLKVTGSAPTIKQAELKVKAGLWRKNRFRQSGSFNIPGDPNMISGVNFDLTGSGNMSGKYHITVSTHTLTGQGDYNTSCEIRKTGSIPAPKTIPATEPQREQYDQNTDDYNALSK